MDAASVTQNSYLPEHSKLLECAQGHLLQMMQLSCRQGFVHTRACAICRVTIPRKDRRLACCAGCAKECNRYEVCVACAEQQKRVLERPSASVVVAEPEPEQETLFPALVLNSAKETLLAASAPKQAKHTEGIVASVEAAVTGGESIVEGVLTNIATLASDEVHKTVPRDSQLSPNESDRTLAETCAAPPDNPEASKSHTAQEFRSNLPLGSYTITSPIAVTKTLGLSDEIVAKLAVGHKVEVLEITHVDKDDRVRARISEPHGFISLRQVGQGDWVWALPKSVTHLNEAVGEYVIKRRAAVNADVSITGKVVAVLKEDTSVDVLEIIHFPTDDRLRARIADPAGYISLQMLSDSDQTWANPASPLFSESRPPVGTYVLKKAALVSDSVGLDGKTVALLEPGNRVDVLQILHRSKEQRIRALLREPRGYISLRQTDDIVGAVVWAMPCLAVEERRGRLHHSVTMPVSLPTSSIGGR